MPTSVTAKDKSKVFDPLAGPDPQWPPAPNPARLKWVALYHDEYDVGATKKTRFLDVLSGVKRGVLAFQRPVAVAVDSKGLIYVGDFHLGVLVIDVQGKSLRPFPIAVGIKQLTGLAVDDSFVYVADAGRAQVLLFDKAGAQMGAFGRQGDLQKPDNLALSRDGKTLWVADAGLHQVVGFDLASRLVRTKLGGRGNKPGQFNYPVGVATLSNGDLVVGDFGNFRIQILSPSGKPLQAWGAAGDRSGSFFRVKGVAVDSNDHIYGADGAFSNIQVFDKTGQLLTIVGEPGQRKGQFNMPVGLCYKDGRLYVADQLNQRIQVIRYAPEADQKGGTGGGEK